MYLARTKTGLFFRYFANLLGRIFSQIQYLRLLGHPCHVRIAIGATCQLTISLVSSAIPPDMALHCKLYSVDFKRQVLASLQLNNKNISETARQHGVNQKLVQRWHKQQEELEACGSARDVPTRKHRKLLTHF